MNTVISRFLFLIFVFCTIQKTQSQEISKTNLSHTYNIDNEVGIKSMVINTDKDFEVFVKFFTINAENFLENYDVVYHIQPGYNHKPSESHTVDKSFQVGNAPELVFKLNIPKKMVEMICVIQVTNLGTKRDFYFDIPVALSSNFDNPDFYISRNGSSIPVFEPFIPLGTSLNMNSSMQAVTVITGFKYNMDFEPAAPPMLTRLPAASGKSLVIDSVFNVRAGQSFQLTEEGLYFFQSDTTKLEGVSIRITNEYFPKLAKIENLIEPLVYLSTRLEFKNLSTSEDPKVEMDKFWLKVTGTPERAKRTIRHFYRSIESSNILFTNYKPGWKTDRGMIFATFGPPDEVYRNEFEEIWIYDKRESLSRIKFNFIKVKNIFSKFHYELKRDKNFEKFWYRTIDLWRKGRKGI